MSGEKINDFKVNCVTVTITLMLYVNEFSICI